MHLAFDIFIVEYTFQAIAEARGDGPECVESLQKLLVEMNLVDDAVTSA